MKSPGDENKNYCICYNKTHINQISNRLGVFTSRKLLGNMSSNFNFKKSHPGMESAQILRKVNPTFPEVIIRIY